METLDLEGATSYYVKYGQPKVKTQYEAKYNAFKAGAVWQKEQDKKLLRIAVNALQAIGQANRNAFVDTIHPIVTAALTLIEDNS